MIRSYSVPADRYVCTGRNYYEMFNEYRYRVSDFLQRVVRTRTGIYLVRVYEIDYDVGIDMLVPSEYRTCL